MYSVNGLEMNTPASLTSESTLPKRSSAAPTIRSEVAGSAMSPSTATRSGSSDGLIVSAFATTAQPRRRYAATTPAPMPWEPPVTIATRWSLAVLRCISGTLPMMR